MECCSQCVRRRLASGLGTSRALDAWLSSDRVHCALILGHDARQILSLFVMVPRRRRFTCTHAACMMCLGPNSELAEAMEILPDTISLLVFDYYSNLEFFQMRGFSVELEADLSALKFSKLSRSGPVRHRHMRFLCPPVTSAIPGPQDLGRIFFQLTPHQIESYQSLPRRL